MTLLEEQIVELAELYHAILTSNLEEGTFSQIGTKEYYLFKFYTFQGMIAHYTEQELNDEIAYWRNVVNDLSVPN